MHPKKHSTRLTRQFEKVIFSWPDVLHAEQFTGHIAYSYKSWTFAHVWLADTDILLLHNLTDEERSALTKAYGAGPDTRWGKGSRFYWSIPLNEENLPELILYVRRCYNRVVEKNVSIRNREEDSFFFLTWSQPLRHELTLYLMD